jgi:hypothetical protein
MHLEIVLEQRVRPDQYSTPRAGFRAPEIVANEPEVGPQLF